LLLVLLLGVAARAQGILDTFPAPNPDFGTNEFGRGLASLGDIDSDGFADVAIASKYYQFGHVVHLVSGATGGIIWVNGQPVGGLNVLTGLANVGDVDADGFPDLALALSGSSYGGATLDIHSGQSGQKLASWHPSGWPGFGSRVTAAGDLDGDGFADIAFAAPDPAVPGQGGEVFVRSVQTGQDLLHWAGQGLAAFGIGLDAGRDVDGDGVPDIIIGTGEVPGAPGSITVRSGATDEVIWVVTGDGLDGTGPDVAAFGDVDGDGRSEVAIGHARHEAAGLPAGRLTVHRGRNGSVLAQHVGGGPLGVVGAVAALADLDGDGAPDLALLPQQEGGVNLGTLSSRTALLLHAIGPVGGHALHGRTVVSAEDFDGDGVPELYAGDSAPGALGAVHRITVAPPVVKAVDPPSVTNWPKDDGHVRIEGSSLSFVYSAIVRDVEVTLADGLDVVDDGTLVIAVPRPMTLGPADIVLRTPDARLPPLDFSLEPCIPPKLDGPNYALTHVPTPYDIGAPPWARGLLLVSGSPVLSTPFGFPMVTPLLVFPGPADAYGLGQVVIDFPPETAGLFVWLQHVIVVDGKPTAGSDALLTWVVF
jgi:hypothetical protein